MTLTRGSSIVLILNLLVSTVRSTRWVADAVSSWRVHIRNTLLVMTLQMRVIGAIRMHNRCWGAVVDLAIGVCVSSCGRSDVMGADVVGSVTSASGVFVVFFKVVIA